MSRENKARKTTKLGLETEKFLRYGFTENEIIDAIVNRKPVTVKAMYYLSEKFLLQRIKEPPVEMEKRSTLTNRNSERDVSRDVSVNERQRQGSSLLPKRSANSSRRINIQKFVGRDFLFGTLVSIKY